jgi:hypothetical protein
MVMRRTLGALLLTAALAAPALAGCGDDGGPRAEDGASPTASGTAPPSDSPSGSPADSPSQSPSGSTSDGSGDFTEVALLRLTGGGGRVGHRATVLDDPAAVDRFAAQFRSEALGNQLTAAIREVDVPQGRTLAAAVVSIGCDVPPGVTVEKLEGGLAILPLKVPSPLPECLAAVTTVALVAVDDSML